MSVIGSPGIDISATCFRPPACAGLAEIMAASAATITDVERDFIGSLPVTFLGRHWRHNFDSAEKPSVHPSRASEPVLSLTKERTEERLKSLESFPSMPSLSKHS